MLTGSIEVAAAVDGVAVTPIININGARGEITIVLGREAYPNPDGHLLAVTLSLSAAADGFVLGRAEFDHHAVQIQGCGYGYSR